MANEAKTMSTGRRIWLWTAVIISALLLVLVIGGIIGAWVGRSAAIDVADGILEGVNQLAALGRESAADINQVVGEVKQVTTEVETAVDQVSSDVADRGLLLTLLPPEKEQELENNARRIRETLDSIRDVVTTAVELLEAINNVPFVNLPQPDAEKVAALQSDIQAIRAGVDQLTANIQQFREEVSAEISGVAEAAGEINSILTRSEQNLAEFDNELALLQEYTVELKQQVRIWTAVLAVVLTLIFAWIVYALVMLIRYHWSELQAGHIISDAGLNKTEV